MEIAVREFRETDIADKVRWINDPANNRWLHYDLPLTVEGTARWFGRARDAADRLDCTITADGVPCGVIGLLHIDAEKKDAEFYITVGEPGLKRNGVAYEASRQLLAAAFSDFGLERVYLYTETGNLPAQGLFEKLGFVREGRLPGDAPKNGKPYERFLYALQSTQF